MNFSIFDGNKDSSDEVFRLFVQFTMGYKIQEGREGREEVVSALSLNGMLGKFPLFSLFPSQGCQVLKKITEIANLTYKNQYHSMGQTVRVRKIIRKREPKS